MMKKMLGNKYLERGPRSLTRTKRLMLSNFGLHQPPTGFSIQPGQANRPLNFPYKPHHSLQIFQLKLLFKTPKSNIKRKDLRQWLPTQKINKTNKADTRKLATRACSNPMPSTRWLLIYIYIYNSYNNLITLYTKGFPSYSCSWFELLNSPFFIYFSFLQYILETSVYPREAESMKELRELTAKHPWLVFLNSLLFCITSKNKKK